MSQNEFIFPNFRLWPPPPKKKTQFFFHQILPSDPAPKPTVMLGGSSYLVTIVVRL